MIALTAALLVAAAASAAFLLSRRSFVLNAFGLGLALEVAGEAIALVGNGLAAVLESL